jgi:hypothetical protein
MKMDVRTPIALCLLVATATAVAQTSPQETQPAPQQNAPATPPPAPATPASGAQSSPPPATTPATPALPRLPSQQYQYTAPPQSPPPPQYQYQNTPAPNATPPPPSPPPPQKFDKSQWSHSETTYYEHGSGFKYHPFRFHIDGGGTLAEQSNKDMLENGWNAGLGFSFFPTSHLPLGIRVDGTYNEFDGRPGLLSQATSTYGTQINNATQKMWGGDVDLELDASLSPYVRLYLLAGGGWYRQQTTYRQRNYYRGLLCDWWGCEYGYYGVDSVVARTTGTWHFAKNAGVGFEFALSPSTSFFVEARYMRLNPNNARSDFVPIRAGLRF